MLSLPIHAATRFVLVRPHYPENRRLLEQAQAFLAGVPDDFPGLLYSDHCPYTR